MSINSILNRVSFGRFGSAPAAPIQEKTQETLKKMGQLNARVATDKNTTFDITDIKFQAGNDSLMARSSGEELKADFALAYAAGQSAPNQDNLDVLKTLEDKGFGAAEITISRANGDDTSTTIAELIADTAGNVHNPVTTEAVVVAEAASESAPLVSDDGVFKMSSVEALKNLSQAEQDSIRTLDIQGNIIEFEAALASKEITVPKGIEKFKFTLTGDESNIDSMKTALDMTAHHMSNQLSAEGIDRAGQQVKFIADFKDIKFSVTFAKAHPSIIGTVDAAKTLRAKMGEHPDTKRKITENVDAILDKALAEVETVTSPTELDYVIPGSIYAKDFTGRDNYARVIDALSNQMGTSTNAKAAELKSRIESKSHEAEVEHSDVIPVTEEVVANSDAAPTDGAGQTAISEAAEAQQVIADMMAGLVQHKEQEEAVIATGVIPKGSFDDTLETAETSVKVSQDGEITQFESNPEPIEGFETTVAVAAAENTDSAYGASGDTFEAAPILSQISSGIEGSKDSKYDKIEEVLAKGIIDINDLKSELTSIENPDTDKPYSLRELINIQDQGIGTEVSDQILMEAHSRASATDSLIADAIVGLRAILKSEASAEEILGTLWDNDNDWKLGWVKSDGSPSKANFIKTITDSVNSKDSKVHNLKDVIENIISKKDFDSFVIKYTDESLVK